MDSTNQTSATLDGSEGWTIKLSKDRINIVRGRSPSNVSSELIAANRVRLHYLIGVRNGREVSDDSVIAAALKMLDAKGVSLVIE